MALEIVIAGDIPLSSTVLPDELSGANHWSVASTRLQWVDGRLSAGWIGNAGALDEYALAENSEHEV